VIALKGNGENFRTAVLIQPVNLAVNAREREIRRRRADRHERVLQVPHYAAAATPAGAGRRRLRPGNRCRYENNPEWNRRQTPPHLRPLAPIL
jgi:hypothetical protein